MRTQAYKKLLTNKLLDIRRRQNSPDEIAIERTPEVMDEIQGTADRELALTARSQAWKTCNAVSAALQRIADSTYGICTACEERINERRLDALPWAEHCIVCQQRAETEPELAVAA
jgi:DnaK suppressor protein